MYLNLINAEYNYYFDSNQFAPVIHLTTQRIQILISAVVQAFNHIFLELEYYIISSVYSFG